MLSRQFLLYPVFLLNFAQNEGISLSGFRAEVVAERLIFSEVSDFYSIKVIGGTRSKTFGFSSYNNY